MEKSDENSHRDWKEDGRQGGARGQDFDLHLQSYKTLQSNTKLYKIMKSNTNTNNTKSTNMKLQSIELYEYGASSFSASSSWPPEEADEAWEEFEAAEESDRFRFQQSG